MRKALRSFSGIAEKFRDPVLPYAISSVDSKLKEFRELVNDPAIVGQLIQARETLIRNDFPDTSASYRDSAIASAREFITFYDTLQMNRERFQQAADSLNDLFQQSEKKIRRVNQLLERQTLSQTDLEELTALYGKQDDRIKKMKQAYSGIQTLSLGRTLPDFSNLTLQNVNVNGINLEYARNNVFMAVAAGIVDFRIRDFLYSHQRPVKQYVYAARVGFGIREKDHLLLTYFRGRKQLFGGSLQSPSAEIQGISLAAQFFIYKAVKIYGEVAQSGVPYTIAGMASPKSSIRLNDHSQRAYSLGFTSYFPQLGTTADGYYRHSGLNYQSFNGFQYNAAANSWAFGLTQVFWKKQLTARATFRKNDFTNPLVQQRFNASTVFKNITLTLRKAKWPVISAGYMPASQYTAIGNQVYENHYQTITGTVSYQYDLGIAKAGSLVMVSRFFNDKRDSGLLYYNSKNFLWNQSFRFNLFTATLNISTMSNQQYRLIVMEEGVSVTLFKAITAGFAVKINNLNKALTKVGFTANAGMNVRQVGQFSVWMDQSYLPSLQQGLFRYQMYNIGFTRYFSAKRFSRT